MKEYKTPFISIILVILYRILLDYSYRTAIYPTYAYMGYQMNEQGIYWRFFVSYCSMLFLFLFTPRKINKPSDLFLNLQFLLLFIPILTYYTMSAHDYMLVFIIMTLHFIQYTTIMLCNKYKLFMNIRINKTLRFCLGCFIISILLTTSLLTISRYGLPTLHALNIYNVYKIRAAMTVDFPLNYFVSWSAKIIIPFMLCKYFLNRRYAYAAVMFFLEIFFYLTYAHKIYLLISPAIIISVYIFSKKNIRLKLILFFFLIVAISISLFNLGIGANVFDLMVRRGIFTQTMLHYCYYDFFTTHSFVYFADGLIGKLAGVTSSYEMGIPFDIANYYFGRIFSANSGYIADAFANAGLGGAVIISIVWSLLLSYLDTLSLKSNRSLVLAIVFFPFMMLFESAFLTSLLTGGICIVFVLLFMHNSSNSYV